MKPHEGKSTVLSSMNECNLAIVTVLKLALGRPRASKTI